MVYDKFFGIDRACGRKADTSNALKDTCGSITAPQDVIYVVKCVDHTWYTRDGKSCIETVLFNPEGGHKVVRIDRDHKGIINMLLCRFVKKSNLVCSDDVFGIKIETGIQECNCYCAECAWLSKFAEKLTGRLVCVALSEPDKNGVCYITHVGNDF